MYFGMDVVGTALRLLFVGMQGMGRRDGARALLLRALLRKTFPDGDVPAAGDGQALREAIYAKYNTRQGLYVACGVISDVMEEAMAEENEAKLLSSEAMVVLQVGAVNGGYVG